MLDEIAQMLPLILAGTTGSPNTVDRTIAAMQTGRNMKYQAEDRERQQAYEEATKKFGQEIFSLGTLPNETQIATAAGKYGINPQDAMKVIVNFMQFHKMKQGMGLDREQMDFKKQQHADNMGLNEAQLSERQRQFNMGYGLDKQKMGMQADQFDRSLQSQESLQDQRIQSQEKQAMLRHMLGLEELSAKERLATMPGAPGKGGGKLGYEQDKAKLVDDTRAYYSLKARGLMDGLGQLLPENQAEYQKMIRQMEQDMTLIEQGKLPTWYDKGSKTEKDQMFLEEIRKAFK